MIINIQSHNEASDHNRRTYRYLIGAEISSIQKKKKRSNYVYGFPIILTSKSNIVSVSLTLNQLEIDFFPIMGKMH